MKLTRRGLGQAVLGTAAAAKAMTQDVPEREDDLKAARDRIRRNSEALAGQHVPLVTEPAFHFDA